MNDCVDAIVGELAAVGLKHRLEHGGKHVRILWEFDGAERVYVTASTPSDRRAPMNVRAEVRRMLREDGLLSSGDIVVSAPRLFLKDGAPFCSSLDIAAHFEKAHKDVLRSIDRIHADAGAEFAERNFAPSTYLDQTGRSLRCFDITRDGFTLLGMGFTGASAMRWKLSYIDAFNAMESEITALASSPSALPAEAVERIARLEGDLAALIDLSLEAPKPPKVRKAPFVRPSVLRRMMRACAQ